MNRMPIRSRAGRLGCAVAATVALVSILSIPAAVAAGGGGTVSPAGASTTAKTLTLATQSVTTTTGKKLDVRIQATWDAVAPSDASVLVQLSSIPPTATGLSNRSYETFSWTFHVAEANFTASPGGATISVPSSKIGWYGHMLLKLGASSHTAETCSSGSGNLYTGTVTGAFDFNSTQNANSGWGGVHDSSVSWKDAQLDISSDCTVKTPLLGCVTGYTWSSPSESLGGIDSQEFGGEKATTVGTSGTQTVDVLYVLRTVSSQIDGTMFTRGDYELDPGTNTLSGTQQVSSKPATGSAFTGSSSLRLSQPALKEITLQTGGCKGSGGKTESGCTTLYGPGKSGSAAWSNGSPPLLAKLTIGGNVTEGNRKGSGYTGGSITVLTLGKCKT
jgi:hypothetical protein